MPGIFKVYSLIMMVHNASIKFPRIFLLMHAWKNIKWQNHTIYENFDEIRIDNQMDVVLVIND